jgi:hypothetical protein
VPVTVKLSKRFYDKFGHDVVNELVNWFNQVDATYRTDLRELNELNFARFDAKLEQRAAELEAKLGQRMVALEAKLGQRMAALENELGQRMAALEAKLGQRMAALEVILDHRFVELRAELLEEIAAVRKEVDQFSNRMDKALAAQKADLIKWMFVFWAGTALAVLAVVGL